MNIGTGQKMWSRTGSMANFYVLGCLYFYIYIYIYISISIFIFFIFICVYLCSSVVKNIKEHFYIPSIHHHRPHDLDVAGSAISR